LLFTAAAFGQSPISQPYIPGVTFQTTNPNYPLPNPFYFEGRIDWNLLKITTPVPASGTMHPPPCMFTVRLRLAGLLRQSSPRQAIALYQEVITIDPLLLGVHEALAETYAGMAETETDPAKAASDYNNAITEYKAELDLSPITDVTTGLTGDLANNAHVHWGLAQIYRTQGSSAQEASELDLYLKATLWHSDTYPWRLALAQARLAELGITADYSKTPVVLKPKYQPAARPRTKPAEKAK
jgi:tetratricopeptide (TPR) repeat protein